MQICIDLCLENLWNLSWRIYISCRNIQAIKDQRKICASFQFATLNYNWTYFLVLAVLQQHLLHPPEINYVNLTHPSADARTDECASANCSSVRTIEKHPFSYYKIRILDLYFDLDATHNGALFSPYLEFDVTENVKRKQ